MVVDSGERLCLLEPVILSDVILNQARLWVAECQTRSPVPPNAPPIGEAILISPVDDTPRRVMLRVASIAVKGKTVRGIFSDTGSRTGDGYTLALDTDYVAIAPAKIIHVLLHELIHSLDPRFDMDEDWQDQNGQLTDKAELYRLASEQRAFTGMWIEALRIDLSEGRYNSPDDSNAAYRQMMPEFDYFCAYNAGSMDQVRSAFAVMVNDLQNHPPGA
jgi:hypothetical protein